MSLGPGKYNEECTLAREKAEAEAVLLLVFNGRKGSGFSFQAPLELHLRLPAILRRLANEIEADSSI